jgi:hypothetical protein
MVLMTPYHISIKVQGMVKGLYSKDLLKMVVARQSIAVGASNGDDGFGEILVCKTSRSQMSSGARLNAGGREIQ